MQKTAPPKMVHEADVQKTAPLKMAHEADVPKTAPPKMVCEVDDEDNAAEDEALVCYLARITK